MRITEDLLKKDVIDADAREIGVITDIIISDQTFEITDIVTQEKGFANFGSNEENVIPIDFISVVGDKVLIKSADEIDEI
ncbi:MAG: PRC-barrel domain-containing protein [Methanobrevibacter sp.]|nr:PRC-barrel domain-containing protein [Methanobrevibacter sp.]